MSKEGRQWRERMLRESLNYVAEHEFIRARENYDDHKVRATAHFRSLPGPFVCRLVAYYHLNVEGLASPRGWVERRLLVMGEYSSGITALAFAEYAVDNTKEPRVFTERSLELVSWDSREDAIQRWLNELYSQTSVSWSAEVIEGPFVCQSQPLGGRSS